MLYQLDYCPYQRPFRQPLYTNHGPWSVRTGLVLRLTDEVGRVGWGEIAPLPWFGSETLEQAIAACEQLPTTLSANDIEALPATLPACQFGLEMALLSVTQAKSQPATFNSASSDSCLSAPIARQAALLPAGAATLDQWPSLWAAGYRTLKWKIAVQPMATELALLEELCEALPPDVRLRLDANGGLTEAMAEEWLRACDRVPHLEFLEQPLAADRVETMIRLAQRYQTPLALDESVASLAQLVKCHQQGWRGIIIVKPAIVGSPQALNRVCQAGHLGPDLDLVFSSVFETAIGRGAGWQLAMALGNPDRAMGYGLSHWFADGWDQMSSQQFPALWQQCLGQRWHQGSPEAAQQ